MVWPCFWLKETGKAEIALRRYASSKNHDSWTCEEGWHEAIVWLGIRVPCRRERAADGHWSYPLAESLIKVRRNDRRWPKTCAHCDYRFTDEDRRQVWAEGLFRRADTGELRVLHWKNHPPAIPAAEPGALRDAWWYTFRLNPDRPHDRIILMVRCPNMRGETPLEWCPDSAATGGGFWARTGDPRRPATLTINPSIAIGEGGRDYHGFLHGGVLTDHIG